MTRPGAGPGGTAEEGRTPVNVRKVSIAICTWNRCESLDRTLDALRALRIPAGIAWEVIVVNNNGTDATDAVVTSYQDRLPVLLLQEPTPGLSYARNRALRAATGDIMVWTDDDVLVDAGWIERILNGFAQFDADFVFGPSTPVWAEGTAPVWFSDLHHGKLALIDYGREPFIVKDLSTPFFGLNFAVKRDLLVALGCFREDLGVKEESGGGEDIDLFRRAVNAGRRIVYVPDAVVQHVIPPIRTTRAFHRQKLKAGLPIYYQMLEDQYHAQPWLLGVPRFLYGKLLKDGVGYARSVLARDPASRFHYELQILKFTGVYRQAAARRRSRARHSASAAPGRQA